MSERKIARLFKKIFAVLMTLVLVIGMNGNQTVLKVRAEGEPTSVKMKINFDDRGGNGFVSIKEKVEGSDDTKVNPGGEIDVTVGKTYEVTLNPPEERTRFTPEIEVRFFITDEPDLIYSNTRFFDERTGQDDAEPNLPLSEDNKFEITIPSENCEGCDVNIWWSAYDRAGGWYDANGESDFCLEVCGNDGGEAYLDGVSNDDYHVLWEYEDEETNSHSGAHKIIIPSTLFAGSNDIKIKFHAYEGWSFGRFQLNGTTEGAAPIVEIDAAELQEGEEPEYILTKDIFIAGNGYLNSDLSFDGGGPSFNVFYDDNIGEVDIFGPGYESPSKLGCGPVENFAFGETYTFTLLPPDNRKDMYIVEARIYNLGADPTVYTNIGEPSTLPIIDDTFTLTLPAEENFCGIDINIWWSEYDRIGGNENEYCFEVRNDGHGEAYLDGIGTSDYSTFWEYSKEDSETHEIIDYGSQKLIIPKNKIEGAVLRFAPYDGYSFREYEIELPGQDPIRKEAKDFAEDQVPGYILSASDFDRDGNLHASVLFDPSSQPGDDITVFYRIEGDGTVLFEPNFSTTDNNGWKVGSLESNEITINVSPYEGLTLSKLLINNVDVVSEVVDNQYSWTLSSGENYIEVFFGSGSTPGPEPGGNTPGEKLKGFIEEQRFLFGDWNGNSGVTTDDLKLGIAQQIFYPQFSDPRSRLRFQESYPEIDSYEKLVPGITIGERDSSKDITAIGGNGTQYTIPAYKYTFTFTDENNSDRNVNAEGIAWLFEITDTSVYATDSVTNVLMEVTNENGESTFFLRNCKWESPDCIDPVTKEWSGEGAYCVVGDYKVVFDAEKNAYVRSVSIFGNAASLDDFLMTQDDELEMCTFQGSNVNLLMDAFEDANRPPTIFGKFSFYQSSYTGMKIQGAGAAGNTPAWSFATDPIWGSDENSDTEKEAIVYFGNDQVAFKPITVNGVISKITDLSLVDTSIPAGVIEISPDGDTWYVEFNSNFYDKVEFAVTYETASGPKTEYIWVHRVGIDIQASNGGSAGGSTILMHGTENGPRYTFTETCETIVYATYYYPEDGGTDKLVDLYATITWKDGSVTKEIIRNDSHLHLDFHHDGLDGEHTDDVQSDDFILYKGSKAGAPQKIEVSAVVSGFESTTSFTGMRLGSGKGVCWNNNITN